MQSVFLRRNKEIGSKTSGQNIQHNEKRTIIYCSVYSVDSHDVLINGRNIDILEHLLNLISPNNVSVAFQKMQ